MKPGELIRIWVDKFNKADVDELMSLYDDDATNHQVANEPVAGKDAIRQMFEKEFSTADMHCIIENIFEDNEWGILEWKDPMGLRGCGFFHIVDNKIRFQRGYWDKLSFLRLNKLPMPKE